MSTTTQTTSSGTRHQSTTSAGRRLSPGRIGAWLVLWFFILLTIFPFYWMLRTGLSNNRVKSSMSMSEPPLPPKTVLVPIWCSKKNVSDPSSP